jgi:GPH family glycoside/pentoside/hexuronide:cation symporter
MSVGGLSQYVYIYHLYDGDLNAGSVLFGWKSTVNVITGLASVPLLTWLSTKFDKRNMVLAMLLVCIGSHSLYLFTLNPAMPYLIILPSILESCGISAVWLFLPSMKADLADYDEVTTHRRREGSLNAFYSWFMKVALTASVGIGGFVLQFSGFNAAIGHQPPEVIQRMLGLFIGLPLVFWAIAFALGWMYPLTRDKMTAIRADLEKRRGVY